MYTTTRQKRSLTRPSSGTCSPRTWRTPPPGRPLRHGPAPRRLGAHPPHGRRLRPREGHGHHRRAGARQDDERDDAQLRAGRLVRRLRGAARAAAARREWPRRPRGRRSRRRPIYPQLRAFKEAGNRVTGIIGFQTRTWSAGRTASARPATRRYVCTDDGSTDDPARHGRAPARARDRQAGPGRRHRPLAHDEGLRGGRARTASRPWSASSTPSWWRRQRACCSFGARQRRRRGEARVRRRPRLRRSRGQHVDELLIRQRGF